MNEERILYKLILKGDSLVKKLLPSPGNIHYGSDRIRRMNNKHLDEATEWKTSVIHFLKNKGELSDFLEEFSFQINKKTEISGEFYKENIASALGVLKSIKFFYDQKDK